MRRVLVVLSLTALLWLLTAALLHFIGAVALERTKLHLLLATLLWFLTTPWWMARETDGTEPAG